MAASPTDCFHCGEALAGRAPVWVHIGGVDQAVCCPGCRAAAQLIANLGLDDFYKFRTAPPSAPAPSAQDWSRYDVLTDTLTRAEPGGRGVTLALDGMTCAACSWLITRSLQQMDGVAQASVNTATGRAHIVWDEARVRLSQVLRRIADLGFRPQIVTGQNADALAEAERRGLLKRLAVAGAGMMQVMMFAVALYVGNSQGMDPEIRSYLRIVSLLVATPVMLYGGWPYFTNGAASLAHRAITMDVPVSLALILAYGASVFNTWRGAGEVYFDSVTMFIFFLTVARYVEMVARHRSTQVSDSMSRMLPLIAHRLTTGDGASGEAIEDVAAVQLEAGDRLLIRSGEIVPADGPVAAGASQFDESMLTGESLPVERALGEPLAAGTVNLGAPVEMQVSATGGATVLAGIVNLLHRAQSERPRITRAADRMASRFLVCVLLVAAAVCAAWCVHDASRAFGATLAVLVVACPCAFSLATLVAVASANAALARRGILVTHPDALESLSKVTRVVFDKTGTLSSGRLSVADCSALGALCERDCRRIAAALELASEHPIARAFDAHPEKSARELRSFAGGGVEGIVEGRRYRIGTRSFATCAGGQAAAADDGAIVLAHEGVPLAAFTVEDSPRPESPGAVAELHRLGLSVEILSGDAPGAVSRLARQCGIESWFARQLPADKLERVKALTRAGEFIAMVGDGINDAPVLGGAGVSIAMSRGSALALASADLILVGDSLQALPAAFRLARRTNRVIRQNLLWAGAYNLVSMPLAALGWVPPWAAAIGMSSSSILVVLNALRLMRGGRPDSHRRSRGAARALKAFPLSPSVPLREAAP